MAIMASVQPESGWIIYIPDLTSCSILVPFFKEGPDDILQDWSGSDLDGRSGFGQMHLIWKQAGMQESLGLQVSSRMQPAFN